MNDWLRFAIPFWVIVAGTAAVAASVELVVWVTRKAYRDDCDDD